MALSRPSILLLLLLFLLVAGARSDASVDDELLGLELESEPVSGHREVADSALKIEVDRLRSRISSLEFSVAEKSQELKSKDDAITHMNHIIKEKSDSILVLQREVEEVEKKGAVDAAELVEKAHARAAGLEKQIEKLKSELQLKSQRKDDLEARVSSAEKGAEEIKLKLETLQKTNDEQKQRIKKISHALKVAEESLLRTQEEAASTKKELRIIYEAWLPPWLANHFEYSKKYTGVKWKRHGKPTLDTFLKKTSDVAVRLQTHIEPHLETVKTKYLPLLEEKWTAFSLFAKPHMEFASAKAVEIFETSVTTMKPYVKRVHEVTHPYVLQAKNVSKPYVDQVATVARPHVERVRITLRPYTKKIVRHYAKFLKSATAYHLQVQGFVQEILKKYDLTRALATKELVWFLASACLALPVYFLYEALSYIFCNKPKKSTRSSRGAGNTRNRNKRRHADHADK